MSAAISLTMMTSCNPADGPDSGQTGKFIDYSAGRIKLILPDAKTVEADADGVSISIKSLDAGNVVFNCRPGANVGSYWVDVIPLSLLYNTLINEGKVDASRLEVEDVVVQLLTTSSSTNGVVFSENNLDDYHSHSFDWMNSTYRNGAILSDCDYVICVAPCFDTEGLEPANVNLCWFKTPAREIVGNPTVKIDVDITYRSFSVVHEPNDDCKYICYWSYFTEQIDEIHKLAAYFKGEGEDGEDKSDAPALPDNIFENGEPENMQTYRVMYSENCAMPAARASSYI